MLYEKKYFGSPESGGGDFDSAPFAVGPNKWINASNIRTLTTDFGETHTVESIGSNILKSNPFLPLGNNTYIGGAPDYQNNRIVICVWNDSGNGGIYAFYLSTETWYIVLKESDVVGGLSWNKNRYIDATRVINGCIFLTDNFNDPRRIDIDAGIKLYDPAFNTPKTPYSIPISQSVISIIRRPPGLPPTQNKTTQTSPAVENNSIAKEAFLFCYRYQFRNYEFSVLSPYSTLCNYNYDTETFNRVDVSIPLGEKIEQDVIQIDVVAIYLQTNTYQIIHSWVKYNPADAAAINAHNSGSNALSYPFYNDSTGITLDSAYSVKPFDSVPIVSKTLETAKNRLFLGNNTLGYDAPILTSLSPSFTLTQFNPNDVGSIIGYWYLLKYKTLNPNANGSVYLLYTTNNFGNNTPTGQYWYTWSGTVPPFPASVNESDLTFRGSSFQQTVDSFKGGAFVIVPQSYVNQGAQSTIITGAVTPSKLLGKAFKSDASYQLSVTFYDNYGRKCGVVTNANCSVKIPDTGLLNNQYVQSVNWTLSNVSALTEIPSFTYYYSVNVTKCLRTRFFMQCVGPVIYAAKDSSNNYTFTTTAYDSNLAGVAIDVSLLQTHSMGYSFNEGDIAKVVISNVEYTLAIIDQSAQYIVCQLQDVGSLSAEIGLYEIYTPYKRLASEPNYEVADIYPILNPQTNTRQYSATTGIINGDIYLINRTNSGSNYIAEAMNLQDKFYQNWFTDSGRPNFVDTIGQEVKDISISFSNTFIPNSKSNGLSTFEALNEKSLYPECGSLQKLQLTSKVEGEIGSVMLGICIRETASLYLGETQIVSAVSNAFIAQDTGVIGTINILKGSFGTISPESVVEFRGNVFWVDVTNGKVIQYSSNGLYPISSYNANKFWKLFCDQYGSMTKGEIEELGSRPFIFSCVDSNNWELLISVPKLLIDPPYGYLPDYPGIIYPFDMWDGQAKTVVYKINANPNHWTGSYPFSPEGMIGIQNKVFSLSAAQLYEHNSDIFPCKYYGVTVDSRIMFVGNQVPNKPKSYNNISVEGNLLPSFVYFRTEPSLQEFNQFDLEEQASDLLASDFEVKEGQMYAAIYRNKIQQNGIETDFNGLLTGNKIRAISLLVWVVFSPIEGPLELKFINLGYAVSHGHTT